MDITAFITVRNGAPYLENCIRHLRHSGLDVVVIDNESTDATAGLLREFRQDGLIENCVQQPYRGHFRLREQLQFKLELMYASRADWVLHLDIDEMPHSRLPGESLAEAIARADRDGYNVLNFEEFVFLPMETEYTPSHAGFPPFRHYYFYAPSPQRLMRAWKRELKVSNVDSRGHQLHGTDYRLSPERFVLRHYMFLSQQHAFEKYSQRTFDPAETAQGWHLNRIGHSTSQFRFPSPGELETLDDVTSHELSRARPHLVHYWQWNDRLDRAGC